MSQRKKGGGDGDSLDLLLDALCNMFGGIIFIALMIVLLTSESTKATVSENSTSEFSHEIQTLKKRADLLEEEIDSILEETPESKNTIKELLETLNKTRVQKNKAGKFAEKSRQLAEEKENAVNNATNEIERLIELENSLLERLRNPDESEVAEAIEEEIDSIKETEQKIESLTRRRVVRSRLPREQLSSLGPLFIIVSNSKAYIATTFDSDHGSFDKRDVTVKSAPGEWVYTPRTGGGFVVTESVSTHPRFIQLLRTFNKNRYLASMFVSDDSHKAFQHLRAAFIESGWAYNLKMQNGPLTLASGERDGSVQ